MILTALLIGIATGTAAATAACLAWRTGALEDERTRTALLEEAVMQARTERDEAKLRAQTLAATDPTEQLLADALPTPRRGRRRKENPDG